MTVVNLSASVCMACERPIILKSGDWQHVDTSLGHDSTLGHWPVHFSAKLRHVPFPPGCDRVSDWADQGGDEEYRVFEGKTWPVADAGVAVTLWTIQRVTGEVERCGFAHGDLAENADFSAGALSLAHMQAVADALLAAIDEARMNGV